MRVGVGSICGAGGVCRAGGCCGACERRQPSRCGGFVGFNFLLGEINILIFFYNKLIFCLFFVLSSFPVLIR